MPCHKLMMFCDILLCQSFGNLWGYTVGSEDKEFACNAGALGSTPGLGIPWKREWLPTPVFLPGEFHGQRNLAGYSPSGHKESDMTK